MCKYCEQKLRLEEDGYYDEFDNQIKISEGGWTSLYIGIDKNERIVLRACGDDFTDDCLINFCPFCGKKLQFNDTKTEAEKR